MPTDAELEATFRRLREILAPQLESVIVKRDDDEQVYLEWTPTEGAIPEMLAAVMRRAKQVAFHYMPVYNDPALLETISDGLRKRMQGKSCFNFANPDDLAIAELDALVQRTAPNA